MSDWYSGYDDELEDRQKAQTDLDRYFAQKSAELAQKEAELAEREREAKSFYESSAAKAAADALRWRNVQQQITPNMTGEDIIRLYKQNGI